MTAPYPNQPTQMRLEYAPQQAPSHVELNLSGLTVSVTADVPDSTLFGFLQSIGAQPEEIPEKGVAIPVRFLRHLATAGVEATCDDEIAPLWELLCHRPADDMAATLKTDPSGRLVLGWDDGSMWYTLPVSETTATAVMVADTPIVATDEVWRRLERIAGSLGVVGHAHVHPDGFIEIQTATPQRVESLDLPGLFRTHGTSFGISLRYVNRVVSEERIRWSGPVPARPVPQTLRLPDHLELAPHMVEDLPDVVADLEMTAAAMIVWDSGLGRRVFALSVLEALDAFPATLVVPPSAIWVWQRHANLLGRSCALSHDRGDLQLVTYTDLEWRSPESQAIVFDSVASDEASRHHDAVRSMAYMRDALRIGVSDVWPDDLTTQVEVLETLRPAEFDSAVPLPERYSGDAVSRFRAHAGAYLHVRRSAVTAPRPAFRRSTVQVVEPSTLQQDVIDALFESPSRREPVELLAEMMEVVTVGPPQATSPVVVAAAGRTRAAVAAGRRVAVVTRHRRAVTLLRAMLRPQRVSVWEPGGDQNPKGEVVLVRFDQTLPSLRAFDEVVVIDYPWSLGLLDAAVGSAIDQQGPDVTVIHASGTIADRLVLLAATRDEIAYVSGNVGPPSDDEIDYLLSPR